MSQLVHHSGLEPFADDPDQASVGNALFQHLHKPVVIDVIKEPFDVRFDDPSMCPVVQRFSQLLSGFARAAARTVTDAFVNEVVFPDGFEDHLHGLLHDFIFQHGDAQRSQLAASRFGNRSAAEIACHFIFLTIRQSTGV